MPILTKPILMLLAAMSSPVGSTVSDQPLPELEPFLQGVLKNLRTDRELLSQYTYTQKTILHRLKGNGEIHKTETRIWEVYPSIEGDLTYRRQISTDGAPVGAEKLEQQDREQRKRELERARKREKESPREREKRKQKEAEELRKEGEAIRELHELYNFRMIGREPVDGKPTIVVGFTPRPDGKPRGDEAKILKKLSGRAWVDEVDHQVVRVEMELLENIGVGLGVLARFHKGARASFQRRKVNDEIWLPVSARFAGTGRILLFKGMRLEVINEYSDYRKFSVETKVAFPGLKNHP